MGRVAANSGWRICVFVAVIVVVVVVVVVVGVVIVIVVVVVEWLWSGCGVVVVLTVCFTRVCPFPRTNAPNYGGHVPVDMALLPCAYAQGPKNKPSAVLQHLDDEMD